MKNILKGFAAFMAVVIMGSVLYLSLFGNTTHAAVSVGSAHSPIEVELRKNGEIKKVTDPTGKVDPKAWVGKHVQEIIPVLVEHSNTVKEPELIVSSTFPEEDRETLKNLIAEIQKNSKKTGIILLESDLKDYMDAKEGNQPFNAYLMAKNSISLWDDDEATVKTPEEKRTHLKAKAAYYQSNDDLNRRNEIKKQEEKRIAEEKKAQEQKKAEEKKAAEAKAAQARNNSSDDDDDRNNSQRNTAPAVQKPAVQRQQPQRQAPRQTYRQPARNYDDDDDDDWDDDDDDWDDDDD